MSETKIGPTSTFITFYTQPHNSTVPADGLQSAIALNLSLISSCCTNIFSLYIAEDQVTKDVQLQWNPVHNTARWLSLHQCHVSIFILTLMSRDNKVRLSQDLNLVSN